MRLFSYGLLVGLGAVMALGAEEPAGARQANQPADPPARPKAGTQGAAEAPRPGELEAEIAFNEKLLRDAGHAADGPGLLAFFRAKVLSEADQERLKKAVVDLGNDGFAIREKASRELLQAGRFSLPFLRPVVDDPDLERARRAEQCIEDIERMPVVAQVTAAAQLAAVRQPAGISDLMLACLPWIEDESAQGAIFSALAQTGLRDGRADPALIEAAKDREALRRAAAAHVLGRAGMEQRRQAVRLLTDSDVRVRFHAACALVRSGEKSAVPSLLAQLTEGPLSQAWQAEDLLCRLAGEQLPGVSPSTWDDVGRRKCRDAWETWWKEHSSRLDLTRVNLEETYLGLNVIAELDGQARGGRVWECGPDGKPRWEITNVNRPIDAHLLPGGRVLVAEHGNSRVSERDREGKVLWEHTLTSQPVSVQRLPSGNTFIVTYNELLEVTPASKVVFSVRRPGMIYHGMKLRNGNMIYVNSNSQVVELDPSGREMHLVPVGNTSGWASVEKLHNGHYLVALYSGRKVVEVDNSGKVIWEAAVEAPGHATQLRSGNILVASIEGRKIIEINRSGTVVWQQATQGRPFHVHRR